jgi:hypothetical protein
MAVYKPVTDAEWDWLVRRFPVLGRTLGARELIDRSLPASPYPARERREFRHQIFELIRSSVSPMEAYPNPYFELTWLRAVKDNPDLLDNTGRNRLLLWNAYFRPGEAPDQRERDVESWKAASGELESLPIVTDTELPPEMSE